MIIEFDVNTIRLESKTKVIEARKQRSLERILNGNGGAKWIRKSFNRIKYQSKSQIGIKYWSNNHHTLEGLNNKEFSYNYGK